MRLGELTTPLLDKVIGKIKAEVGPPTAKTCRSVISGTLGLAARYGAIDHNPIRDVDTIEAASKRKARALTDDEREAWFDQLRADPGAVAADLPDLSTFMLATGGRIGESLAVLGHQVNFAAGEVEITHQIIRVRGQGLLRIRTNSRAGERVLKVPAWGLAMLRRRLMDGCRMDQPVFANADGDYRDPTASADPPRPRCPVLRHDVEHSDYWWSWTHIWPRPPHSCQSKASAARVKSRPARSACSRRVVGHKGMG